MESTNPDHPQELKAERVFQVISQPDAGPAWAELEVLGC